MQISPTPPPPKKKTEKIDERGLTFLIHSLCFEILCPNLWVGIILLIPFSLRFGAKSCLHIKYTYSLIQYRGWAYIGGNCTHFSWLCPSKQNPWKPIEKKSTLEKVVWTPYLCTTKIQWELILLFILHRYSMLWNVFLWYYMIANTHFYFRRSLLQCLP